MSNVRDISDVLKYLAEAREALDKARDGLVTKNTVISLQAATAALVKAEDALRGRYHDWVSVDQVQPVPGVLVETCIIRDGEPTAVRLLQRLKVRTGKWGWFEKDSRWYLPFVKPTHWRTGEAEHR